MEIGSDIFRRIEVPSSSRLSSRIITSDVSCFPVLTLIRRFQFHSSYRPRNPKNQIIAKSFSRTPKCARPVRRCEKKEKQIFFFRWAIKSEKRLCGRKFFISSCFRLSASRVSRSSSPINKQFAVDHDCDSPLLPWLFVGTKNRLDCS